MRARQGRLPLAAGGQAPTAVVFRPRVGVILLAAPVAALVVLALAQSAAREERRRLSRDLHDAVGQGLSTVAQEDDLTGALIGADVRVAQSEIWSLVAAAERLERELRYIVAAGRSASFKAEAARAERGPGRRRTATSQQ